MLQSTTNYVLFVIILSFSHRKALIIRVAKNNLKTVVIRGYFRLPLTIRSFIFFAVLGVLIRQRGIIYAYVQWQRSALALAIAGVTAMSGPVVTPDAKAAGFIDDSTLTGGIYYWQRERDRKDVTEDKYKTNLSLYRTPIWISSLVTLPICSVGYCRLHGN